MLKQVIRRPANKRRGEKGARDKVTERRTGKEGVEQGRAQEPLAIEGGLYWIFV